MRLSPIFSWTWGFLEHLRLSPRAVIGPGARLLEFLIYGAPTRRRNRGGGDGAVASTVCSLDVHNKTVVACVRLVADGRVENEVRTFKTTTADLLRCRNGWRQTSIMSRWRRPGSIGSRCGTSWMMVNLRGVGKRRACEERAGSQDRRQRCDVADRALGARFDPGELRAGYADPGDARPAAHAQTKGA